MVHAGKFEAESFFLTYEHSKQYSNRPDEVVASRISSVFPEDSCSSVLDESAHRRTHMTEEALHSATLVSAEKARNFILMRSPETPDMLRAWWSSHGQDWRLLGTARGHRNRWSLYYSRRKLGR